MTKNQPMNQSTMNSSETAEFSDLDWLKVQEELSKIQPPTEPFLTKAARLTKENPFVPFGEFLFIKYWFGIFDNLCFTMLRCSGHDWLSCVRFVQFAERRSCHATENDEISSACSRIHFCCFHWWNVLLSTIRIQEMIRWLWSVGMNVISVPFFLIIKHSWVI